MDDSITLEYDLSSLPTAQHKAGLAGLVLSIQEMQNPDRSRGSNSLEPQDIPELNELTETSAKITLTERSCQKLFDDCYAAIMGTVEVEKPWKNAMVARTFEREKKFTDEDANEKKSHKVKTVTVYVHPNLEPRNPVLDRHLFQAINESKQDLWYRLWRDMLWAIPRAIPTTRNPYKETESGSCKEGAKMWSQLVRFQKARDKNQVRSIPLSSALLLGAQDSNAEHVDFAERVDNVLALHFWPLTTLIYVPYQFEVDAANPSRSRSVPVGFSLAIPDVANLRLFCSSFPRILSDFKTNAKPKGYRPDNACVEIAAESALDLLTQQAWLAGAKTEKTKLSGTLHAVTYIHVEKQGKIVKTLASGRIAPDPHLLKKYELLRKRYYSSLFRNLRLSSLLDRNPDNWWQGFAKPLSTLPHELLLSGTNLPYFVRGFCNDIRTAFSEERSTNINKENSVSTEPTTMIDNENTGKSPPKTIEQIVMNMVRNYVIKKSEDKSDVKFDAVKKESKSQAGAKETEKSEATEHFEKNRRKLAERLFLEVRSRHGRDFASYFARALWCIKTTFDFLISRFSSCLRCTAEAS